MYDAIIVGGGPAGISCGLTLKNRGKSVLIITNPLKYNRIWKTKMIENYPGLPKISGEAMLTIFENQAKEQGIEFHYGKALNAVNFGESFGVSDGKDFFEAKNVVIATGFIASKMLEGEEKFLGDGVSYCATCDGMLYRNKKIVVLGFSQEAEEEAEFLRKIGCEVEYFTRKMAKKFAIVGDTKLEGVMVDDVLHEAVGVFVLRESVAPSNFIDGLELDGINIKVDENMETNIKGVYAIGDIIGKPYQIARSVGQGNTAALAMG